MASDRHLGRATPEPAPPGSGGWLRRLSPFLLAHKRDVFVALGVAVAGQAVAALTPVVEKIIIDDVVVGHRRPLAPWLAALIVAGVVGFGAAFVRRYVGGRVALDVQFDLRNAVYERLQRLDFATHDQLQTGQLVSRANSDVALLQGLMMFLPIMIGNLVLLVMAIGVMAVLSPPLTIVALVAVWFWRSHQGPPRNHYAAVFADASEVVARNDVRLNDVIVGKVTSVTLDGLHAKVRFSVDRDVHLPAGTRAELRQVSLLGEQYLALVPSGHGELADGTTIPLSRTRRATDFERLVGVGGELAANIAVSQVNQLTAGFANAFGDDPGKLGRLLDASAATAKAFNDHTPELLATIDRVEQLSAQLAPHSAALASSIDDLAAGMKALDAHRGDLSAFTTGLATFSDRMAALLTGNEARFTNGIPELKHVFGELVDSTNDIHVWLDNFYGLNAAWSCIGDGNFLDETFLLAPAFAIIVYGPGHGDPEKGTRSRTMQHQLVVPTDGSGGGSASGGATR